MVWGAWVLPDFCGNWNVNRTTGIAVVEHVSAGMSGTESTRGPELHPWGNLVAPYGNHVREKPGPHAWVPPFILFGVCGSFQLCGSGTNRLEGLTCAVDSFFVFRAHDPITVSFEDLLFFFNELLRELLNLIARHELALLAFEYAL